MSSSAVAVAHTPSIDFLMYSWDRTVFKAALNDSSCINIGTSIPIQACATMGKYWDLKAQAACTAPDLGTLKEPTTNSDLVTINALPGCNPLCELSMLQEIENDMS